VEEPSMFGNEVVEDEEDTKSLWFEDDFTINI
jgi:hypothetical protein